VRKGLVFCFAEYADNGFIAFQGFNIGIKQNRIVLMRF